jgi:hypothetical protein
MGRFKTKSLDFAIVKIELHCQESDHVKNIKECVAR